MWFLSRLLLDEDDHLTDGMSETSQSVPGWTLSGMLEGRHYNRALRTQKIVLEALMRLNWQTFIQSAFQDRKLIQQIEAVEAPRQNVCKEVAPNSIQALYDKPELKDVLRSFEEFNLTSSGKMGQYWLSYIEWLLCYYALYEQRKEEIGTYTLRVSKICCRGCLRVTILNTHAIY